MFKYIHSRMYFCLLVLQAKVDKRQRGTLGELKYHTKRPNGDVLM